MACGAYFLLRVASEEVHNRQTNALSNAEAAFKAVEAEKVRLPVARFWYEYVSLTFAIPVAPGRMKP